MSAITRATSRTGTAAAGSTVRALGKVAACLAAAIAAASALAGGAAAATVHKIEAGRANVVTLLLQGPIATGDLKRVQAAVAKVPAGTSIAVILDSPGGNLGEGLMLGAYFHEARIATIAKGDGGICYSACALAFLGGRDSRTGAPMRLKMSGGKLGFHQFSKRNFDPLKIYTRADYDEQVAMAQEVMRDIVRYLKLIGEDLSKLQLMLRASSNDMNIVSNEECLAQGFKVLEEDSGRLMSPASPRQRISSLN